MGGLRPPRSPRGGGERTRDSDRPLDMQCAIIPNRCIRNKHSGPRAHLQTSDNMRLVFWTRGHTRTRRGSERKSVWISLFHSRQIHADRPKSPISHAKASAVITQQGENLAGGRSDIKNKERSPGQRRQRAKLAGTIKLGITPICERAPNERAPQPSRAPRLRSKSGRMAPNITRRLNITL